MGLIPGWGRYPGGGHGNPPQYSCLENPTDREAWRATVHRVAKSRTRQKRLSTHKGLKRGNQPNRGNKHVKRPYVKRKLRMSLELKKRLCLKQSYRMEIRYQTRLVPPPRTTERSYLMTLYPTGSNEGKPFKSIYSII